jgi:ATP:ADP antiporter, AAA family
MASAGLVAFDMAGRATRDALFLSHFTARALPAIVFAASAVALLVAILTSSRLGRVEPVRLTVMALLASAGLLLLEGWLVQSRPTVIAVLLYLHFTTASAVFISAFWTIVSERFDSRTAKRAVGRIAAAGTVGGLCGGLLAERVAAHLSVAAMLPVLALLNGFAAWALRRLGTTSERPRTLHIDSERVNLLTARGGPMARQRLSRYVRLLLLMVALAAVSETVLDFLFMTRAKAAFPSGEDLLRLFALFYTGIAVLTVGAQLAVAHRMVNRLGLSRTAATLPGSVLAVSGLGLLWPGLTSAGIARGTEMILRNSTFRSAYELLFNALHPREKRSVKLLVDVTAQRAGRIGGSVLVLLVILAFPGASWVILLVATAILSASCLATFHWLQRGHLRTLEESLLVRAAEESPATGEMESLDTSLYPTSSGSYAWGETGEGLSPQPAQMVRARDLESSNPREVIQALWTARLSADLVDKVIPLLDWDDVARDALRALEPIAPLVDHKLASALVDPRLSVRVQRRVALLLGSCPTPAARDGLVKGLSHPRFEVRYRCGRGLSRIVAADPKLSPTKDEIQTIILKELAVGRRVWASQRTVERLAEEERLELLGEVIRERADRNLEHLFALLALCLPAEPIRAAYRGLISGDAHLRATALDYLERAVPSGLKTRLWELLEESPSTELTASPQEDIQDLLRVRQSIAFRVEELRRQKGED